MAKPGEQLLLLNEQTIPVDADVSLMIADDQKPLGLAGIMGGEDLGITLETTELFLESAFFAPPPSPAVRALRLRLDASHRFERGVDFGATRAAIERATQLIIEICGGQACPLVEAAADLPARKPVRLRVARVAKVLGVPLQPSRSPSSSIAWPALHARRDDFLVTPPSYRFDIEIEEDLIEEVARLHGYDNIPAPARRPSLAMLPQTESARPIARIRQILADGGYQEVVNFAFVEEAWEADFSGNTNPVRLANPIASQMSVMRSTLFGGLVANLANNLKRKQARACACSKPAAASCAMPRAAPWPASISRGASPASPGGGAVPEQWGARRAMSISST